MTPHLVLVLRPGFAESFVPPVSARIPELLRRGEVYLLAVDSLQCPHSQSRRDRFAHRHRRQEVLERRIGRRVLHVVKEVGLVGPRSPELCDCIVQEKGEELGERIAGSGRSGFALSLGARYITAFRLLGLRFCFWLGLCGWLLAFRDGLLALRGWLRGVCCFLGGHDLC